MVGRDRVDCFGGRDLLFDADIVIGYGMIIDRVPFGSPSTFVQVMRAAPDAPDSVLEWPVFITDAGATLDSFGSSVPLVVADTRVAPQDLPARLRARVTGHYDDPAATGCRRPQAEWPEITDEQAVAMCRMQLVVTRIEPID